MKRYIHTKASTSVLTTRSPAHAHTAKVLKCRLSHSSHAWTFLDAQKLAQTVTQSDNTDTFRRVKGK